MIYPKNWIRLVCLWVIASAAIAYSAYAEKSAGDVVTMANGDFHIGQVKQDQFVIETVFGDLHIESAAIVELTIIPNTKRVKITTHLGEHIRGQLKQISIDVSRVQSPTIPVALADIARINFASRTPLLAEGFPTRFSASNGEVYQVSIASSSLILLSNKGMLNVETDKLRFIDANIRTDEDQATVQLTQLEGTSHLGRLLNKHLTVDSPYLTKMKLPLGQISRLSLPRVIGPDSTESVSVKRSSINSFTNVMRNLGVGPEMLLIKSGTFQRGDYQGDGDFDEKPLAKVELKAFAIGRYEVTFAQYDLFCEQTRRDKPDDQGWGRGQLPVINVSWQDADAYVDWLSVKTGKAYRLPSDAEWEYASRAGSTTRFWWGDELTAGRANCEGCGSLWDGDKVAPIGRFEANAFGLYDTAGNAFEWVADCFHDRFSEAPADGSPVEKAGCGKRVIRGGAWSFPAKEIRSANRWRDFPSRQSDDTGFRVAMNVE